MVNSRAPGEGTCPWDVSAAFCSVALPTATGESRWRPSLFCWISRTLLEGNVCSASNQSLWNGNHYISYRCVLQILGINLINCQCLHILFPTYVKVNFTSHLWAFEGQRGIIFALFAPFAFQFAVKLLQITNQEHVVNSITRVSNSGSSCTFKKCQA